MTIKFCMRDKATSADYDNEDMSLDIAVASLHFSCNRPTVAALMAFGSDIQFPAKPEAAPTQGPEGDGPEAQAVRGSSNPGLDSLGARVVGGVPSGAGDCERTLFRLGFEVAKLELQLEYEGFRTTPLAKACVSNCAMAVSVFQDSMNVTADLGNVEVEDCNLALDSPYRQICGLRQDTDSSLIHMTFTYAPHAST